VIAFILGKIFHIGTDLRNPQLALMI